MIIPTVIGTVASAMTIIKYMIEVGRYFTSDTTEVLIETQREAARLSPDKPAKLVDDILVEKLRQHLPQSELETTAVHLGQVMEVIQPVVNVLTESREKAILPRYGWALQQMVPKAGKVLAAWGCFQSYGVPTSKGDYSLVFPQSYVALHACADIWKPVHYLKRKHQVYLYLTRGNSYLVAHDSLEALREGYVSSGVVFAWGDYGVFLRGKGLDNFPVQLATQSLETIVMALLRDLADYSQRVQGAVHATQGFLARLAQFLDSRHGQGRTP